VAPVAVVLGALVEDPVAGDRADAETMRAR